MRKKLKENKGSISTVVTVTVLFFTVILSTAYMVASTNRKTQIKSELVVKETYEGQLSNLNEVREEITGLPKTDETQPYFPSSSFKRVVGTNLENGLVIEDSEGNQYVWVEVPKNTTVYQTAGLNIANFTDDEYTKIENDLHTYTSVYRNNTTYSDTWAEDTANEGWLTESEYYTLKKKMLKSVYQNGGFYVGRYEAGIDENEPFRFYELTSNWFKTLHPVDKKAVIKMNSYPYIWVSRTQANNLAQKFNSGNKTSSLMFGVQWDLIIAFINKNGKINNDYLINDSSTIGNYCDGSFKLDRGKYTIYKESNLIKGWNSYNVTTENFVSSDATKLRLNERSGVLYTTGASERNKQMNIYDICGNTWEWTLEKTNETANPCTGRGGGYWATGSSASAVNRAQGSIEYNSHDLAFRVVIY